MGAPGQPLPNQIRLMPVPTPSQLFVDRWVHAGLGLSGRGVAWCRFPESCLLCDEGEGVSLRTVAGHSYWQSARPFRRAVTQIVDMNRPGDQVQLFGCSEGVKGRLLRLFQDDVGEIRDLTDPDRGHDVRLAVSRDGISGYPVYERIEVRDRATPLYDRSGWLSQVQDLAQPALPTLEQQAALLAEVRRTRGPRHRPWELAT